MAAQEGGHELVDAPRRRVAEDADRDGAAAQRGQLADAVGGVLDGAQAAGGVLGERAPGLGGHHAAAGADEEVGAERLLELADLLGDRGLGDAQSLGGGGEGAELERRAEAADLLQRQKLSLWTAPRKQAYLGGSTSRIMAAMTRDVVIIGGGIAGLAAAWRLRHRDVLLLEAGDRLGGRMRSDAARRVLAQLRRAPVPGAGLAGRRDGARVRARDRAGDRRA